MHKSSTWIAALLLAAPDVSGGDARVPGVLRASGLRFELLTAARMSDFVLHGGTYRCERLPGKNEGYRLHLGGPLTGVLHDVQSRRGSVVMDCAMFAQIAAHLLAGRGGAVTELTPMGFIFLDEAPRQLDADFAYVSLSDPRERVRLHSTIFINKGQWLIRLGADEYLGLAADGVRVSGREAWTVLTRRGLATELRTAEEELYSCASRLGPADWRTLRRSVRTGVAIERNGGFDHWSLEHYDRPAAWY